MKVLFAYLPPLVEIEMQNVSRIAWWLLERSKCCHTNLLQVWYLRINSSVKRCPKSSRASIRNGHKLINGSLLVASKNNSWNREASPSCYENWVTVSWTTLAWTGLPDNRLMNLTLPRTHEKNIFGIWWTHGLRCDLFLVRCTAYVFLSNTNRDVVPRNAVKNDDPSVA